MDGADARDETVYDAYLAGCAAGRPEEPAAVFARHPGLGGDVRSRIEDLWRMRGLRPTAAPALGRLGGYRLVEKLDVGGMGAVHRALRERDGAEVALKVLRPELSSSPTALERLRREALALARVRHENVVRVLEMGEDDGVAFLVLGLVPGRGMDRLLAEATARGELLPVERVLRWGAALARGLASAHAEGVVHRDVKPSNVQIRPDDEPVLLDFGIAQVPERTPGALTTTFAGSPFYAAPEQLTGEPSDGRTDVYGLCATLYQCLTGRVPFASDRFEEVLRRTLAEEPVPVRKLAPHVPRDVETVVLAGLEKDPARRPQTAEALAHDLDAARQGRPIRCRRPGPARALGRGARRHPAATAAIALAVVAGAGVAVGSAFMRASERSRALDEAGEALRAARARMERSSAGAGREAELASAVRKGEDWIIERWLPDEAVARLDAQTRELESLRREREEDFLATLSLLDRAERLAPGLDGLAAARAHLHLMRWREAAGGGDASLAAFHRGMVERADPHGDAAREVSGSAQVAIVCDPPDADVYLFRCVLRDEVVEDGGRRLVALPWRGAPQGVPQAPFALRVVRGAGEIPEGAHLLRVAGHWVGDCVFAQSATEPARAIERIVSIGGTPVRDILDAARLGADGEERAFAFVGDGRAREVRGRSLASLGVRLLDVREAARRGGVAAALWEDGVLRDVVLPPGIDVRLTAAPLLAGPMSRIGPDELRSLRLPPGEYVVLARRAGRLDVRQPLLLDRQGSWEFALRLPAPEERPPGCVLSIGRHWGSEGRGWIQEREVTAGEYLEFLNDPATLAAIDASEVPIRVPRHQIDPPLWPRGADGRYRLPDGTPPDHPALGVSWEDAVAYARWLDARATAAGEPWRHRLPTGDEWVSAAGAEVGRRFPFGPSFRPRWVSSCFARPYPAPERVLTHPVDESPFGVFDLCGGAMEWCDDWFDAPRGLRLLRGGSWAQGDASAIASWSPHGARPERADREFGFRLVLERAATPSDAHAPGSGR